MEVGDQPGDDLHFVAWGDHEGGAGLESGELMLIQIIDNELQRFAGAQVRMAFVGVPLVDMKVAQGGAILVKHHADPIEAFQGAGAGGANGNDAAIKMVVSGFELTIYER